MPEDNEIQQNKPSFWNKMPIKLSIIGAHYNDLNGTVIINHSYDLDSIIRIRHHNRMKVQLELVEPPLVKMVLSPIEDTHVRESNPRFNYGRDHDLFVGAGSSEGNRYRGFLRFRIDSIPLDKKIKKATLVLHRLNSRPAIPIGLYDIPVGEIWTEYGLTWGNQPSQGALIKTYDSGTYAGLNEIDLTSYIEEWYEGRREHNGFMLRTLDEFAVGAYKQYGSRESDLFPSLEIEYYDPVVYSIKKEEIRSSVFIVGLGSKVIESSVVVSNYLETQDVPGSVFVRDPYEPSVEDLGSSVHVSRDTLPCSMVIVQSDREDMPSRVMIRLNAADDLKSLVQISKPEIPVSIYIRPHFDLEALLFVFGSMAEDLSFSVTVNTPERQGSIIVRPYIDMAGTLEVRGAGCSTFPSYIMVNTPDKDCSVIVRSYRDFSGAVTIRSAQNDDLPSSLFVISDFINSSVTVRIDGEHHLSSSFLVRAVGDADLLSTVLPRVVEDLDLMFSLKILKPAEHELSSTVIPRIRHADDIDSSVEISEDKQDEMYCFIM
ncbi:hypothetical protein A7K91_04900 [Paenibacillus oryzae]|uniref:Carbohydrate-binding module family 96 domain-containing protein n=2 Tax=Paenibacillus oryzae TaxID=1844972 RepID=A0A1A5YGZ2_9BACL|nr:hypothetical protein A7K91_04900 [Paenibacillus oryzae]